MYEVFRLHEENPCGSSTGSAVGVAAGYAPMALGTETEGSLIQPAGRAALYALKPTPGTSITDGVWLLSSVTDSVGFMSKSVNDLAYGTALLLNEIARSKLPPQGYSENLQKTFRDLSIGFLDPAEWHFPESAQAPVEQVTDEMVGSPRLLMLRVPSREGCLIPANGLAEK